LEVEGQLTSYVDTGAVFSPCEVYRYRLWRSWRLPWLEGEGKRAAFIGLNPSTATETEDDPTIRRCIGFASRWGCDGMEMLNLYAIRSTDPRGVWMSSDPVGEETDHYLVEVASKAEVVVACWGAFPRAQWRAAEVVAMLAEAGVTVQALGVTKEGQPRHPLYIKNEAELRPWP